MVDHHVAPHQEDHPRRRRRSEIDTCGGAEGGEEGQAKGKLEGRREGEGGAEFTDVHIGLHVTPNS